MEKTVKNRPTGIILIGQGWSREFASISEASAYINISRNRIRRALDNPYGLIEGHYPLICVDEALPDDEMEEKND